MIIKAIPKCIFFSLSVSLISSSKNQRQDHQSLIPLNYIISHSMLLKYEFWVDQSTRLPTLQCEFCSTSFNLWQQVSAEPEHISCLRTKRDMDREEKAKEMQAKCQGSFASQCSRERNQDERGHESTFASSPSSTPHCRTRGVKVKHLSLTCFSQLMGTT